MKQFTKDELKELKNDVTHRMDAKNSYKDLVYVYYTALSVLQYFNSIEENKVSQIDLQFWRNAVTRVTRIALRIENDVLPLFVEAMEFEDSLIRARHMCFHPYGSPNRDKVYFDLLNESVKRKEEFQDLRQLAGIYLDFLSNDPEQERYRQWRYNYDRMSSFIEAPKRGFAEEDEERLSLPEMQMMLKELKSYHHIGEYSGCWDSEIERFEKMIEAKKPA